MWSTGEIVQGDSGSTVAAKLDAEFLRIQADEQEMWNKFGTLTYTDQTTVFDKEQDNLIVSPWTLWAALDPIVLAQDGIKEVTKYLSEQVFDGTFWIRSSVMIEYSGSYVPIDDLFDGSLVTKSHIVSMKGDILDLSILRDGSAQFAVEYTPVNDNDAVTKKYTDDIVSTVAEKAATGYHEYDPSAQGDTTFQINTTDKNFIVYLNGVLQRKAKFQDNGTNIVFLDPLSENDEVTITILGGK